MVDRQDQTVDQIETGSQGYVRFYRTKAPTNTQPRVAEETCLDKWDRQKVEPFWQKVTVRDVTDDSVIVFTHEYRSIVEIQPETLRQRPL